MNQSGAIIPTFTPSKKLEKFPIFYKRGGSNTCMTAKLNIGTPKKSLHTSRLFTENPRQISFKNKGLIFSKMFLKDASRVNV